MIVKRMRRKQRVRFGCKYGIVITAYPKPRTDSDRKQRAQGCDRGRGISLLPTYPRNIRTSLFLAQVTTALNVEGYRMGMIGGRILCEKRAKKEVPNKEVQKN